MINKTQHLLVQMIERNNPEGFESQRVFESLGRQVLELLLSTPRSAEKLSLGTSLSISSISGTAVLNIALLLAIFK